MSKSDDLPILPYTPTYEPSLSPDNCTPNDDLPYRPQISPKSYVPSPPIQIAKDDQFKNEGRIENYSDNEEVESSESEESEDLTQNLVESIKNLQPPTPLSPIERKSKKCPNSESETKPGTSSNKSETKQCVTIPPTVQKSKESQGPLFMSDAELHSFTKNFEMHLKAHVAYGKQLIIASREYQDSIAAVKRARERYINLVKVGSKFFGNYRKK